MLSVLVNVIRQIHRLIFRIVQDDKLDYNDSSRTDIY